MHLSLGEHGCGASHSREVTRGVPAKHFKIDCGPCEAYLKGDHRPRKLVYQTDKKTGRVTHQERVADSDPHWSSTPDTVALTPDQEKTQQIRIERGEQQLRALESIATLTKAGVSFRDRPDVLFFLREQQLPEDILQGTLLCADGHDNPSGAKFCKECGMSMAAKAAISSGEDEGEASGAALDLDRLHPQTLKKLCRERHLEDTGTKDELIARLAAERVAA